jgi:hypothetical protein
MCTYERKLYTCKILAVGVLTVPVHVYGMIAAMPYTHDYGMTLLPVESQTLGAIVGRLRFL